MRLEELNSIAKIISNTGENKNTDVYFRLDEHKHEVLQQEVFKFINKT